MSVFNATPAAARGSLWRAMLLLLLLLVIAALIGWWLTRQTTARELAQVQTEAGLIADSRSAAVAQWLVDQNNVLRSVAENPSVQLYADAITTGDDMVAEGQRQYLVALLKNSASRAGLLDASADIKANIPRTLAPGLAIMSGNGTALASVGGPLPKVDGLFAKITQSPAMEIMPQLGQNGLPAVRFAAPVDAGNNRIFVYLVRRLDTALSDRLQQPGEPATHGEAALVTKSADGKPIYLTARRGVAAGTIAQSDPLAEHALSGNRASTLVRDNDGTEYLVTARTVAGSPWTVMRLSPAKIAVDPARERQRLFLFAIISALGMGGLLFLLAWRQGVTERAALAAEEEARARAFLQNVSDRQPTAIAVREPDGRTSFANSTASTWANATQSLPAIDKIIGQPLPENPETHLIQSGERHLLLDRVPIDPAQPLGAQLITAQDISELVRERARREDSLNALVKTLAGLIDARDPGSKNHSQRVSNLAVELGKILNLSASDQETLRVSGLLLNVGKILVPAHILTKAGALTDGEKATLREARTQTVELLAGVPFDGPVAQTIHAATDPEAHEAESANSLARILNFANNYVSMVSPRAHRPAMDTDAALDAIRTPETTALASALAHYLDNLGGRDALKN